VVLAGKGWNVAVIGIVAARFVSRLHLPTVLLEVMTADGETSSGQAALMQAEVAAAGEGTERTEVARVDAEPADAAQSAAERIVAEPANESWQDHAEQVLLAKGSARSIAGFNMHDALEACADLLTQFGGHAFAAGMTLPAANIDAFAARMDELARAQLTEEDLIPALTVDLMLTIAEATPTLVRELAQLAPFGAGNAAPQVVLRGGHIRERRTMGKTNTHLKLKLQQGSSTIDAVGWSMSELYAQLAEGMPLEVAGSLEINAFRGKQNVQVMIADLRPATTQTAQERSTPVRSAHETSATHRSGAPAQGSAAGAAIGVQEEALRETAATTASGAAYVPARQHLAWVYSALRRVSPCPVEQVIPLLVSQCNGRIPAVEVQFILRVFLELQFISVQNKTLYVAPMDGKRPLTDSPTYVLGMSKA
jgi:hypothetical protein